MTDSRLPPPRRRRGSLPTLVTRILTVAATTLVLIGAVAISFVVFVIVLAALLVFGLYLWWKTRHFRRQLQEQFNAQRPEPPRGDIIEGEVIRKREDSEPPQR